MDYCTQTKETIEKQFNDLLCKAKELYPDINQSIALYSNVTAQAERLQAYLDLTAQMPREISTNHIAVS